LRLTTAASDSFTGCIEYRQANWPAGIFCMDYLLELRAKASHRKDAKEILALKRKAVLLPKADVQHVVVDPGRVTGFLATVFPALPVSSHFRRS
jgi:hypothetical protein